MNSGAGDDLGFVKAIVQSGRQPHPNQRPMKIPSSTIAILALSLTACNSTQPTDQRIFDVALSSDLAFGGYQYHAAKVGNYLAVSTQPRISYATVGKTWQLTSQAGVHTGLSVGQGNLLGIDAGVHWFFRKGTTAGIKWNQTADAVLFSIGHSF